MGLVFYFCIYYMILCFYLFLLFYIKILSFANDEFFLKVIMHELSFFYLQSVSFIHSVVDRPSGQA